MKKTTIKATPEEFLDSVVQYGYDAQAALYLQQAEAIGLGHLGFAWLVISKTSRRAWVQPLPPLARATGRRWISTTARLYRRFGMLERALEASTHAPEGGEKES